ncbi:MAG TPA: aldo/keto reductase [Acidobacteriota bacterium]|nr:aldo/keto reductase [Acidobacteriota bacterium]
MESAFQLRPLGITGIDVTPLGLSASYLPGKKAVYAAVEEGINLFFAFGFDVQMTRALRELMTSRRDQFALVSGAYNYIWWAQDVRKALEKRLRQFNTDYIDIFLFLGVMKPAEFTPKVHEELLKLKEEGQVRSIGLSCHDRVFLGRLAATGEVDTLMLRYNAAHRGAERDIFPHVAGHNPGVISYTATRWTYLLRRPKTWPKGARIPTAGECYRFVLSNPHVHSVLTAPRSERELRENIAAVHKGPLDEDDMKFMCEFGDAVYNQKNWFM